MTQASIVESIPAQLLATAERLPQAPAFFVRSTYGWQSTSWRDYVREIRCAARALISLGLQPGDSVAILGFNRPEWTTMAHATLLAGGKVAGIYWTSAPGEVQYILQHAGSGILLVENTSQLAKLSGGRPDSLRHVIMMRGAVSELAELDRDELSWENFLALGASPQDAAQDLEIARRLAASDDEDIGALIYTSGTTGPPKAVMLSHRSLAWVAEALASALEATDRDRVISYLPLAHIAEQMVSVHAHGATGYRLYFADSMEQLGEHLKEVHPTIFFGVPRVWERMQKAIEDKLTVAEGAKKLLARAAMACARHWHATRRGGDEPGKLLNVALRLADRAILRRVKAAIGLDQARWTYSGAAPISPDTLDFFCGLDLSIRPVYGLSESGGPTTLGLRDETPLDSIGQVLPGLKVTLADDGELLIEGPALFSGYAGMPADTEASLHGGRLATGDIGRIDEHGNIFLTGRKKDLLITSGGKNISPANIEADLMNSSLIEHAIVCGDGRHFLTALLTLRPEALDRFAMRHELPRANLQQHPALLAALHEEVDRVNGLHSHAAGIRKISVIDSPLSIDEGFLTATLKVRRQRVIARFSDAIDDMYRN